MLPVLNALLLAARGQAKKQMNRTPTTCAISVLTAILCCNSNRQYTSWRNDTLGLRLEVSDEWVIRKNMNVEKWLRVAEDSFGMKNGLSEQVAATGAVLVFDAMKPRGSGDRQENASIKVLTYKVPEDSIASFDLRQFVNDAVDGISEQIPGATTSLNSHGFGSGDGVLNYRANFRMKHLDLKLLCFVHYRQPYISVINFGYSNPENSTEVGKVISSLRFTR